jgi:putative aldouronate transport system permease protein
VRNKSLPESRKEVWMLSNINIANHFESGNNKAVQSNAQRVSKWKETWKAYKKNKYLFFMLFPILVWYGIFHYGPLYGIQLSFKDFSPVKGIWGSAWIGLDHFKFLFYQSPDFARIFRNTVLISLYHIIFGFPAPIILALLLYELRSNVFKRDVGKRCGTLRFLLFFPLCRLCSSFRLAVF